MRTAVRLESCNRLILALGNEFEEMVAEMQRLAQGSRTIVPEDFEKDVDDNHHIDFITAGAPCRCLSSAVTLTLAQRRICAMCSTASKSLTVSRPRRLRAASFPPWPPPPAPSLGTASWLCRVSLLSSILS